MKPFRSQDPTRWRDGGADAHALESRAALLVDAVCQVQPLTPVALSRIQEQVLSRRPGRGLFGFQPRSVRTRLAFSIVLLLLFTAAVAGAGKLWRKYVSAARKAVPRAAGESTVPQTHRRPPLAAARPPGNDAPPSANAPEVAAVADAPLPVRSRQPVRAALDPPLEPAPAPSPAPTSAVAPHPKATEATLIAEALFDLRQLHDAREALATLDRYASEFPHGVLENEALRTRVEAVVQLGDLQAALALLDGRPARAGALGDDLLLTRAELRAAAGRFSDAVSDFTQVLDGAGGSLVADGDERALYGRAVCLGRLGQSERARVDLAAYQTRFPTGRFAREVERLLAAEQPPSRP